MTSVNSDKLSSARFAEATDAFVEVFTASVDFDQRMAEQDIQGSIAHATMLANCNILSTQERDDIVRGLTQISDPAALATTIDEVLAAHPQELEQYRQGKTKLLGFFVGQVMKKTSGRADPKATNQLLVQKLNA